MIFIARGSPIGIVLLEAVILAKQKFRSVTNGSLLVKARGIPPNDLVEN